MWYPDAVTLRPGVDVAALLRRIDAGPGASVKDSFADLDLADHGFRVLFDAEWIYRAPTDPPSGTPLSPVTTPRHWPPGRRHTAAGTCSARHC
ncbi:hypothetical protein GCM10027614_12800 [Micromonospora vulcania]